MWAVRALGVGALIHKGNWLAAGWVALLLGMMGWVVSWRPELVVHAGGAAASGKAAALPNEACAGCHQAIYESYKTTPMARASGRAADGFLAAEFTHEASGVHYRIRREGERVYLDFARETPEDQAMRGRRELRYFLGSGTRGRTYLFEQEGYWFEIPINWYGKKRVWDMAPGYLQAREMPLTLPIDPGCVRCHASGAQSSMKEAREKYADAPFTQGGITCTACHDDRDGTAERHVSSGGKVALARIGAMEPVERDSVCLNCHLEGEAAVVRQGKRLEDFRPGESVFAYANYFVRVGQAKGGERATSQWEALLASGCRRGAGQRLTCTSCHDPHASTVGMTAKDRVEFYRGKCLACHDGGLGENGRTEEADPRPLVEDDNQNNNDSSRFPSGMTERKATATAETKATATAETKASATTAQTGTAEARSDPGMRMRFGATHHPEERDCAACHMPRAASNDIAHEQVTDHRIPRMARVSARAPAGVDGGELLWIGTGAAGGAAGGKGSAADRDLGLAYAMAAAKGDRAAGERAMTLLKRSESLAGSPEDHEMHAQLGFLAQISGDGPGAATEYGLALAADPEDAFAAGNLALVKAGTRDYGAAVGLWERAFGEDPVQLKAGMNLALVECGLGKREAALGTLERLLSFSPDNGAARELEKGIRLGSHGCGKR